MADSKHSKAAPAASVNESSEVVIPHGRVFALALDVLREIEEKQEDVFCLAVAGDRCAIEEAVVEQNLFRVIQRSTENTELLNLLRDHIENLAQLAGVAIEGQS